MLSMVLCENFICFNNHNKQTLFSHKIDSQSRLAAAVEVGRGGGGRRCSGFVANAGKRKRKWWQSFFFDEEGNWLGLKDDDMLAAEEEDLDSNSYSEAEKFEAWKTRAEAIVDLREAQQDMSNEENRKWEDWLAADSNSSSSWEYMQSDIPTETEAEKGVLYSLTDSLLGREDDDDLLYEDRVFRYASLNSAKFLAVLIIIPCALDFVVHDYVLMPFLDRYVKTVPLAAEMLDVRRNQKLQMVDELKMERARFQLEMEIGKAPPLSDEEVWWELRHKALELRDEWRFENRRAFANIWSDMSFGISLFILLYCNQSKVALLKFTGYKIINNISDTGKAFLIILITDIFLGYHSESGWQTLIEIFVEHYGLQVDQAVITIFICLIPVIIDACVKLWLFKFLPRLSPKVANIFREMQRH
ncbi:putative chloroplast envelope membrane protein, CemA [Rosa chinensis]|uniref:Putative chloroplast envelope membrane protein, CemA n=1 Tax=Rosa chinensis TaxID=74649 RepID=A0A2P6QNV1_ROSCH|nr:chloroplast envelope membrane protein isoform X1 [Rosa chinensis]PRQ35833.1 putative chloroplast envelope membrane protein, CemA [Rosa chinensis]